MFKRWKLRANTQNQSNKAKAGNIKNSTINVEAGISTETQLILDSLGAVRADQKKLKKAFGHYVIHNGVEDHVKQEVMEMLLD